VSQTRRGRPDACLPSPKGQALAASPRVSHCYRRPTYPDWPYALFSMVHARSREQCEAVVAGLSRQTGISDYAILYSTREYKKERVQYFAEQANGDPRGAGRGAPTA